MRSFLCKEISLLQSLDICISLDFSRIILKSIQHYKQHLIIQRSLTKTFQTKENRTSVGENLLIFNPPFRRKELILCIRNKLFQLASSNEIRNAWKKTCRLFINGLKELEEREEWRGHINKDKNVDKHFFHSPWEQPKKFRNEYHYMRCTLLPLHLSPNWVIPVAYTVLYWHCVSCYLFHLLFPQVGLSTSYDNRSKSLFVGDRLEAFSSNWANFKNIDR